MFENGRYKLYQGDCLEVMDELISLGIKFDCIISDIPYGTTNCKWDSVIPFNRYIVIKEGKRDKILYKDEFILRRLKEGINIKEVEKEWKENSKEGMWEKINKLIKTNGAICLFGSEPFSTALRMSNIKNYKYDWKWNKTVGGNPLIAKYRPIGIFEDIIVFGKGSIKYNPIMEDAKAENIRPLGKSKKKTDLLAGIKSGEFKPKSDYNPNKRYPKNEIIISSRMNECNPVNRVHPTQKPVELMEYLIRTYTDEGDLILDFTMGSGSTGVGCMNTNRRFVGIEIDENYFNIAVNRIKEVS